MRSLDQILYLSASDLSNHLSCPHLTSLNLAATSGKLNYPQYTDRGLQALQERGLQHETGYIDHLRSQGREILERSPIQALRTQVL